MQQHLQIGGVLLHRFYVEKRDLRREGDERGN